MNLKSNIILFFAFAICGSTIGSNKYPLLNYPFYDIFPYMENEKWGYTSTEGEIIITPIYQEAYLPKYGLARVKLDGKYGFINLKGKIKIKPKYDFATCFSYRYPPSQEFLIISKVLRKGRSYHINPKGRKQSVPDLGFPGSREGKIFGPLDVIFKNMIKHNRKYEFISCDENNPSTSIDTTNLELDTIYRIDGKRFICKSKNNFAIIQNVEFKEQFINELLKFEIELFLDEKSVNFQYDDLCKPKGLDGSSIPFLAVRKDKYWGIMTHDEHLLTPYKYLSIRNIERSGYALVEFKKGKFGYIRFDFTVQDGNFKVIEYFREQSTVG